jgi:hypothetical protein
MIARKSFLLQPQGSLGVVIANDKKIILAVNCNNNAWPRECRRPTSPASLLEKEPAFMSAGGSTESEAGRIKCRSKRSRVKVSEIYVKEKEK